jgi:phosphoribosylaminoimidazole carboxylase
MPGATVHWYGKEEVKKNRKIGHITVVAESVTLALAKIRVIQVTS